MVHDATCCICFLFWHLFFPIDTHKINFNGPYLLPPPSSLDEDAGFSPWSLWSPCTKTCTTTVSPAMKSRHRQCVKPPCSGSSHQEKACNLPQCPGTATHIVSFCCCQSWWLLSNVLLLLLSKHEFHKLSALLHCKPVVLRCLQGMNGASHQI